MGELAVILQRQQRVGGRLDQGIGIRQQRGNKAHCGGIARFAFITARLREGAAQQAVGQDVHLFAQSFTHMKTKSEIIKFPSEFFIIQRFWPAPNLDCPRA